MAARRRLLVALVVRDRAASEINGLRRALGSTEIARIAPHVTLVPPQNLSLDAAALVERHLRAVAARTVPHRLHLGPPALFASPRPVSYLTVHSEPDDLADLAEQLTSGPLAPPATRAKRAFVPHVTLVSGASLEAATAAQQLLASFHSDVVIEALTLLEQQVEVAGHPWCEVDEVRFGRPALTGRGGRELEFHRSRRLVHEVPSAALEMTERFGSLGGAESEHYSVTEVGVTVGHASALRGARALFVTSFEVDESHRGAGIGGQLLGFVEGQAHELGLDEVLFVDGRAPQFLARFGYLPAAFGLFGKSR